MLKVVVCMLCKVDNNNICTIHTSTTGHIMCTTFENILKERSVIIIMFHLQIYNTKFSKPPPVLPLDDMSYI